MKALLQEVQKANCCAGAVELQKEVARVTSLELPATFVFDYPSMAEMCAFIHSSLPADPEVPPELASPAVREQSPAPAPVALQTATDQPEWMSLDTGTRQEYVEGQVGCWKLSWSFVPY